MICYRCGRELPGKSRCCKGCGTQLRRTERVRRASLLSTLSSPVAIGRRTYKSWHLLVMLFLVCSLLVIGLYAAPPLIEALTPEAGNEAPESDHPADSVLPLDGVYGTVIDCTVPLSDMVISSEAAYSDGSWQKDCVVSERIVLRFVRRPVAESWINIHIFELYPDVLEVNQFDEAIDVSGYTSARIQFTSEKAPDCIIEALCVSDGSYDHLFIVETPNDMFEEQSIFVDDWYSNLILVDSLTGAENYNPAAMITVSSVDVIVEN